MKISNMKTVDNIENTEIEEQFDYINSCLEKIVLYIDKLENENKKLKVRNEELEKQNKKLHETILKMSQK